MRFLPVFALTLTFGLLTACADETKAPPAAAKPADTPAAAFADLKAAFDAANEKTSARFKAADAVEEKKKIREEAKGLYGAFAGKALALAEAHPADPVAADALVFAATRQLALGLTGPDADKVAELLVTKYAANPKTREVLSLARRVGDQGTAFLKAAATKAAAPELKGLALFALGSALAEEAAEADPKAAADLNAQAERYLDEAIKAAPDAATDEGLTVKMAAEGELFAIRNLAVGKPAPEIGGTTLDDKKAKLSDYKGKVVLLDFWATWCPPCRAMIPHERELVKKLDGKPFVLLSVSADDAKKDLTEFQKDTPMPWTHWWDGAKAEAFKTYRVRAFPTMYLIDSNGVIRNKWVGNPGNETLDKAVEALVAEAAKKP